MKSAVNYLPFSLQLENDKILEVDFAWNDSDFPFISTLGLPVPLCGTRQADTLALAQTWQYMA
jgi:hypothetical protein